MFAIQQNSFGCEWLGRVSALPSECRSRGTYRVPDALYDCLSTRLLQEMTQVP